MSLKYFKFPMTFILKITLSSIKGNLRFCLCCIVHYLDLRYFKFLMYFSFPKMHIIFRNLSNVVVIPYGFASIALFMICTLNTFDSKFIYFSSKIHILYKYKSLKGNGNPLRLCLCVPPARGSSGSGRAHW